jgi:hypothetical protein
MHAGIGAAALQEDVMAVLFPGSSERGKHDRAPEPSATKLRVRDDIFEEGMLAAGSQEFGAVINMQVATMSDRFSATKTVNPSRDNICAQMPSARSIGSAAALTSETR